METQSIVVLDFGAQYSQLIARRIREQNVFSVVLPCTASLDEIKSYSPAGIVLSGGPSSVYDADAPDADNDDTSATDNGDAGDPGDDTTAAMPPDAGAAAAPAVSEPSEGAGAAANGLITMNFQNVEIPVLARFISEITGKNFVVDEKRARSHPAQTKVPRRSSWTSALVKGRSVASCRRTKY